MKKKHLPLIALCILIASLTSSFAMEGLKVAVISTNAVLTWPSTNDGETYLVQYRSNLTSTAWTTIADYLPASGSNTITFVDVTNTVTFGDVGTNTSEGGGGVPPPPGGTNDTDTGGSDFISYTGFYQVVRDGAYGYFGDNTNWSGLEQIPVELGNSYGMASTMELTDANGDPVGNSIEPPGTTLTVDTTQMTNGVQDVSVSTSWMDTNGNYIESDSTPTAVNVYNEISFPDWVANYGELANTALFNFTCGHTNETWELDIYGSDYAYIGSFNGDTTTNGTVSVGWNLVDGDGVLHTNDTFFIGVVTTDYESGGNGEVHPDGEFQAQAETPPTYKLLDSWNGQHGGFVAVEQHAWDNDNGSDELYAELDGFISGASGQGWPINPAPQSGHAYALAFGTAQQPGDGNWANFRSALYNPVSRNLVYFGHGGTGGLGYNPGDTNRFIPSTEIGAMLNNIPAGQTNAHHYRFVFCDGCSTAKGNLCDAFGIPHKQNVPDSDFVNANLRFSAFCGWPKDKNIGVLEDDGDVNLEHVNFITFIQTGFAENMTIANAELFASRQPGISSFGAQSMTIYGSWALTFGLDN